MNVKFTCEYNGKDFQGFQRLKQGRSVQRELETALSKYLGRQIEIAASGRTDAGVHARGQVCSFKCPETGGLFKMCAGVNAFLPADVGVRNFEITDDGFHARFSAKSKTYLYRVYVGQHRSPTRDDFYYQIYKMPDIKCTDPRVKIEYKDDEIWFWVTGRAFKYKEVRKIVGELIGGKMQTAPAKGLTLVSVEY